MLFTHLKHHVQEKKKQPREVLKYDAGRKADICNSPLHNTLTSYFLPSLTETVRHLSFQVDLSALQSTKFATISL